MSRRIDLTGQRFGRWVVLEYSHIGKHRSRYWKCVCDCGTIKTVIQSSLRNGKSKSCRCYQKERIREIHRINIPVGTRFGRLVVLGIAESKHSKAYWKCQCDCGTIKAIESNHLREGDTKSCGCYRREQLWLPKGEAAFNRLYNRYKHTAQKRGYVFQLSCMEFKVLTSQNCYYCNASPSKYSLRSQCSNGNYVYNGVDRINNSKGYVPGNTVACCKMCNFMKFDHTAKEFLEHVARIVEYQKSK